MKFSRASFDAAVRHVDMNGDRGRTVGGLLVVPDDRVSIDDAVRKDHRDRSARRCMKFHRCGVIRCGIGRVALSLERTAYRQPARSAVERDDFELRGTGLPERRLIADAGSPRCAGYEFGRRAIDETSWEEEVRGPFVRHPTIEINGDRLRLFSGDDSFKRERRVGSIEDSERDDFVMSVLYGAAEAIRFIVLEHLTRRDARHESMAIRRTSGPWNSE